MLSKAQSYEVQISPSGTSYVLAGERDEDGWHPLVFIHGVGLNHRVWQPQIDFFADRYHVLAYDMLGHGESPLPPEDATLDDYVVQLKTLLDDLGFENVALIGHSMGALVATAFALKYRFETEKLIALNMVYQRTAAQREAVAARAAMVLEDGRIAGLDAALERWFAGKTSAEELAKVEQVRQWLSQVDPVGYGRTYRLFAESDDAFEGKLNSISAAKIFLTGELDPNSTPAMSKQLTEDSSTDFDVQIVANEAHMMAYIAPEKVNDLMDDFLARY